MVGPTPTHVARPAAREERAANGKGRGSPWRTPLSVAAVLGVLALAIVLRAVPLTAKAPHPNYVDEPFVLERSAHMIHERTLDPGWYRYPPLLAETTAVVTVAWGVVGGAEADVGARRTVRSDAHGVIEPFTMILAGRLLTLAAGIGTVLLTMVLGGRLLGRWQGIAAGLLVAVLPALVTRSSIAIVDTPATFFVMGALVAASVMTTSPTAWRWAALAGISSGLAFTSKYPAGAVVVAVLALVAITPGWDRRRRLRLAAAQVSAMVGAAVVSMPVLVTRTGAVLDDIRAQAEIYDAKTSDSYVDQLLRPREVGAFLLVAAIVGVAVLVARPSTRRFTLAWLAFVAVLLAFYLRTSYQPVRNLLPIVPFLIIAAVAALDALARLVERRIAVDPRATTVAMLIVVAGFAAWTVVDQSWPLQDDRNATADHRVDAREWLSDRVEADDRVLVAEELAFLPSELRRLDGEVTVASFLPRGRIPSAVSSLDVAGFDYVVTGRFVPGPEPGWNPSTLDAPTLHLRGARVRGLTSWTTNSPDIRVYER